MNDVIVNPNKFQAMITSCDKKENKYDLNINSSIIISSVDSVAVLRIEIDSRLNFEKHVATIISFYQGKSRQYNLLYILYIYIYICMYVCMYMYMYMYIIMYMYI